MREAITGVILAGGRGSRMGGADKGLQEFMGRPLAAHVLERLAPQVDRVLISANRNHARYAALGCPVLPDSLTGFAGPLAGVQAALAEATTPLLVCVPCDSPLLPADLVVQLWRALDTEAAEVAVPRAGGHVHRAFCLLRRDLLPSLDAFLASGERRVGLWHASLKLAEVDFDDEAAAFGNANTPEELARLATGTG